MFSIFEANLQDKLSSTNENGFNLAKKFLAADGKLDTMEQFDNFYLAINVLKHGRGSSYDILVEKMKVKALPFRIKLPDESFFFEGDASELSTLIEVDDAFVQNCGELISDVSEVISRVNPQFT